MKTLPSRFLPILLVPLLMVAARSARATSTTFNGDGSTAFNGGVGDGTLTVSDDGTGGVDFTFTLGNGFTGSELGNGSGGNDIVIYLDTGVGGGIGASTSQLNDTGDSGRIAISEFDGAGSQSNLNFGGLMNPQYGIDLQSDFGDIFGLVNGGSLNYIDGASPGGTSGNGLSYSISGNVVTLDLPAVDFGLSPFSGATLNFIPLEVSESGYSSNETTASLTGNLGYSGTQTMTSVNSFTVASVPEASSMGLSTVGLLTCGAGMLLVRKRNWLLRA